MVLMLTRSTLQAFYVQISEDTFFPVFEGRALLSLSRYFWLAFFVSRVFLGQCFVSFEKKKR